MRKNSKVVYDKLCQYGVDVMSVYSGGSILPLTNEFYNNNKIKLICNTSEQSCGLWAVGYAKASGKTGISMVTSGPGVTNSITPLLDATNDSTPMILISGQVPTHAIGTHAFQECPAVELTKNVTKWSHLVKKDDNVANIMDRAFDIANNGKKGAVHLDFPKDVFCLNEHITDQKYVSDTFNPKTRTHFNNFERLANMIGKSKRPLLYVGQGCNTVSHLLTEFVIKSNIPITTTLHAVGVFDETLNQSLKFLGMHGNPAANYAMQEADCIIALGSRFDDRTTGNIKLFAPKAKYIFFVNNDYNECCFVVQNVIKPNGTFHMSCEDFLISVLQHMKHDERLDWFSQINQWKTEYPLQYKMPKNNTLNTQCVIDNIGKNILDKDYIVTTGVGNHQMMTAQFMKWKKPKRLLTSGSLGVMGAGLPYAIGAQTAFPNKLVIDIDGDGSLAHTINELQTVARYKLPIKIAVMNDGQQSMVRAWENLFYDKRYTVTDLPHNPDYKVLAEAYGILGLRCDNVSNLKETIETFLTHKGPVLCDFRVQSEICYPLVAPGKALNDMLFNDAMIDKNGEAPS